MAENGQNGQNGRNAESDPTELTTDQLEREILHLRELIEARLDQMDVALVEARSTSEKAVEAARITSQTAVSAAIDAAKTAIVEFDSSISRRLLAAAELHESKFDLIQNLLSSNREKSIAEREAAMIIINAKFDGVSKEFVTFRTLLDANAAQAALALTSADKAVNAAFASSKEAITKAEIFNEKRFDILTKQIDELKSYRDSAAGSSTGKQQYWGYIIAGVGLVATVLGITVVIANVLTGSG